jgi:hypothetical protein
MKFEEIFILVSIILFIKFILASQHYYNRKTILLVLFIVVVMTLVPKYDIEFRDGNFVKYISVGFPIKYIERNITDNEEQYYLEKMRLDTLNLKEVSIFLDKLLINIIGTYLILHESCTLLKKTIV